MALSTLEEQALAEIDVERARPFRLGDHLGMVRAVSVAAAILLWEFFGRDVNPLFLSYPSAIARAFVQIVGSGQFTQQALNSLNVYFVGLAAALLVGILLGLLMGRYRLAEYILDPFVYALDATPRVALIPILLLWFGLGAPAKIAVVFLSGVFPVLMNTFSGVRTVSAGLVEVGRAYGAGEGKIFTKIIVPASLPFIMAGVRLAVGRALIGIITAEMFAAVTGLGALLIRYSSALATDKFFVPVIFLALLGVILTRAVEILEKRFAPWKETERAL
ncbi:MAG TPA: ABC transporter permease [Candidatus Binatia bacterium]|jgi:ABC-type nitrate/sulfonate/bicarbonate transport system permease component|nr:ABC transporter permease [Candidatus Binatia bacterium]